RISVGILLVQDLVVIVSLTVLAGLSGTEGAGHGGGAAAGVPRPGGITARLGQAFLGMGVLVAVTIGAARGLLPRLFGWVAGERETLYVWSLTWCFLLILGAEAFHLSPEMGAFLAGLALAQLPVAHDLYRRVAPLTNFFLAVFFVSLGVGMDPGAAAEEVALVAALVLFVLLGKGTLIAWLLARMGQDEETAFRAGVTLGQASEFSFILVGLAVAADLVSPGLASAVAMTGLVTIAVSTYGILGSDGLYRRLRGGRLLRLLGAPPPGRGPEADEAERLSSHVVVVGMNLLGRTLARRLVEAGRRVVAVDTDPRKLDDLPCPTIHGDALDPAVLEEAGLGRARLLVSALRIEDVNVVLAHRCREAGVVCSVHAFDPSVVERLEETGADHLIVARDEGTRQVFRRLRELGTVG
ncbi:MAG: portal protein, partial [Gemmatimonadetes bacterium]|nr:portal protein [Gemmatimonadota bacterium]NIR79289.1 portal protein [Gemmatimonadota bacterium]NIT87946.1 portal protein [Gemmatimonadota bacterium]NIU31797.1 portal protein [Gemmatimonadota bacterium]NIV62159.1 portal protein [Gemmatimonadota bacterium]